MQFSKPHFDPSRRIISRQEGMPPCLCNCVFDSLHWASPDDLPCWLCLEYCGFLCKRIDAIPRFCGGLLDDNKFRKPGYKEGSRFLEFFVANAGQRLDDSLDILA
jgi:hypothetical protein